MKRYYQLINIDKKNKLYVIDTSYKDEKSIITVPIIYTKYVCSSYKQLSNEYIQYFDLVWFMEGFLNPWVVDEQANGHGRTDMQMDMDTDMDGQTSNFDIWVSMFEV